MLASELQNIISPKLSEQALIDIVNKKSGLCDVKVNKIELGSVENKGDSFLSHICRFTIEASGKNSVGQEKTVNFPVIVKYLPKNIARQKTFRSADFFENEAIFYTKVWTAFQEFQISKKIQNKFNNIPNLLSSYTDGSNDYIAMIDVSYEGYKGGERGGGTNFEDTVAVLKLLAHFHALSLAIKHQEPEMFEKAANSLKETYCSEKLRSWYENFQKKLISITKHAVEKELPLTYLQKFNQLVENDFYGLTCKLCEVRGPLSVVTHGDVWLPNFLLKLNLENGNIEDIIMIDFQFTRYTTLANDITFFLYCCANIDVVEKHFDDLIMEYYKALTDGLERFGSSKSMVTLEDIHKEIKAYNSFGISMAMEALVTGLLEDDNIANLDALTGSEAVPIETLWGLHFYEEKEKRKRIANMIKFSVDKNFM